MPRGGWRLLIDLIDNRKEKKIVACWKEARQPRGRAGQGKVSKWCWLACMQCWATVPLPAGDDGDGDCDGPGEVKDGAAIKRT